MLSKDIKIIFFAIFFLNSKVSKFMHSQEKKVFKKKKKVSYLPTLIFSACNLNHTHFLCGLNIHSCEVSIELNS